MGTAAAVLYEGDLSEVEYFITNIGPDIATTDNVGAFENPIRNYKAFEVTADKRFAETWAIFASYRYSLLRGNFEGFFRSDNAQSDPSITSLFDFPTNDPSYTEIGTPQFGYEGDIRFQGELGSGALPNDRAHNVKLFATRSFDNGLGLGIGWLLSSGRPNTAFHAHPIYNNAGEIPEAPRGSGIESLDANDNASFRKTTDFIHDLSIHVSYQIPVSAGANVTFVGDIFNIFNQQPVLRSNEYLDLNFQIPDPDYGRPREYNAPLRLRVGARIDF